MSILGTPEKDELMEWLVGQAHLQRLVTYSEAAKIYKTSPGSYEMWNALGEISRYSENEWGFLLSSIVVNKTDGFPGSSYFKLAEELGRSVNDKLEFWAREVRRTFEGVGAKDD